MNFFSYKGASFYCEDIELSKLAVQFGTPLYVYSQSCLKHNFFKIKKAFSYPSTLVCYSVKANSNVNILKLLVKEGAGLDVVSGGELYRADIAGCAGKKIVYASVGKTESEIRRALNKKILLFNVESEPELRLINNLACGNKRKADVALRINPDVSSLTHKYTITGKKESKFGIDIPRVQEIILSSAQVYPCVNFCGIHFHIGSQIMETAPFLKAIRKAIVLIDSINRRRRIIRYLDIGGGFGIDYEGQKKFPLAKLASEVTRLVSSRHLHLIVEPGRYIVGAAGVLLTKVIYIKETPPKRFIIVDAAMNDLIRPSLYGAYHRVVPLKRRRRQRFVSLPDSDIVGPICESGDFLARRVKLEVKEGDYLAIRDVGAYGFSMASNYNSRPKPAEVLVDGCKVKLIRKRETWEDLVAKEGERDLNCTS